MNTLKDFEKVRSWNGCVLTSDNDVFSTISVSSSITSYSLQFTISFKQMVQYPFKTFVDKSSFKLLIYINEDVIDIFHISCVLDIEKNINTIHISSNTTDIFRKECKGNPHDLTFTVKRSNHGKVNINTVNYYNNFTTTFTLPKICDTTTTFSNPIVLLNDVTNVVFTSFCYFHNPNDMYREKVNFNFTCNILNRDIKHTSLQFPSILKQHTSSLPNTIYGYYDSTVNTISESSASLVLFNVSYIKTNTVEFNPLDNYWMFNLQTNTSSSIIPNNHFNNIHHEWSGLIEYPYNTCYSYTIHMAFNWSCLKHFIKNTYTPNEVCFNINFKDHNDVVTLCQHNNEILVSMNNQKFSFNDMMYLNKIFYITICRTNLEAIIILSNGDITKTYTFFTTKNIKNIKNICFTVKHICIKQLAFYQNFTIHENIVKETLHTKHNSKYFIKYKPMLFFDQMSPLFSNYDIATNKEYYTILETSTVLTQNLLSYKNIHVNDIKKYILHDYELFDFYHNKFIL